MSNFFHHGYIGVSFFFILSGFLLASIYSHKVPNDQKSLRRFYIKRLLRILPAYYLILLIAAFFLRGQLGMAKAEGLLGQRLGDVILHLTLLQSWVPASTYRLHWNEPSWSVSVEVAFYAIFPLILPFFCRLKHWTLVGKIGALLSLSLIHGAIFYFAMVNKWTVLSDGSPSYILNLPIFSMTTFSFGIIAAFVFLDDRFSRITSKQSALITMIGLVSILAFVAIDTEVNPFTQILLALGMTAFIVGVTGVKGPFEKVLSHPWLLLLGEASYCLYLIQRPLDEWLYWLLRHPERTSSYNFLVISLSIVASIVIWKLYEERIGKWFSRRWLS